MSGPSDHLGTCLEKNASTSSLLRLASSIDLMAAPYSLGLASRTKWPAKAGQGALQPGCNLARLAWRTPLLPSFPQRMDRERLFTHVCNWQLWLQTSKPSSRLRGLADTRGMIGERRWEGSDRPTDRGCTSQIRPCPHFSGVNIVPRVSNISISGNVHSEGPQCPQHACAFRSHVIQIRCGLSVRRPSPLQSSAGT